MPVLAEIVGQSLSSVIDDFMICKHCGIVDRERSRIIVDTPCPSCHKPAGRARLYFDLNVTVLIDLVQQSYHSAMVMEDGLGPQASDVGVVLFFCILREALLNNLLNYLLRAHRVSDRIAKKLLDDNKLTNQKFALLSALIGKSWSAAIQDASSHEGVDFCPVSQLMRAASDIRNRFVHKGSGWGATRDFATDCVNSMFTLLQLFVALHNIYAQPDLSKASGLSGKQEEGIVEG